MMKGVILMDSGRECLKWFGEEADEGTIDVVLVVVRCGYGHGKKRQPPVLGRVVRRDGELVWVPDPGQFKRARSAHISWAEPAVIDFEPEDFNVEQPLDIVIGCYCSRHGRFEADPGDLIAATSRTANRVLTYMVQAMPPPPIPPTGLRPRTSEQRS